MKATNLENDRSTVSDVERILAETQFLVNEINQVSTANLKKINENLLEVATRLRIEAAKIDSSGFKPGLLLEFPDHLRITVRALMELGMATAEDVSQLTGRSRSLESSYLNHLTTMGYVVKKRKGQLVYYMMKFDKGRVNEE